MPAILPTMPTLNPSVPRLPTLSQIRETFEEDAVLFSLTITIEDDNSWTITMPQVSWPRLPNGKPVSVPELPEYTKTHDWLKYFFCFCSLKDGYNRHIKLVTPREGNFVDEVVLACNNFVSRNGRRVSGCNFFFRADTLWLRNPQQPTATYPLKGGRYLSRPQRGLRVVKKRDPSPILPPLPTAPLPFHIPAALSLPSTPSSSQLKGDPDEDDRKPNISTFRYGLQEITPGFVNDSLRLWSPPPPEMALQRIEDMPVPLKTYCEGVVLRLMCETSSGVGYNELVRILGRCSDCGLVMIIPLLEIHKCDIPPSSTPLSSAHTSPSSSQSFATAASFPPSASAAPSLTAGLPKGTASPTNVCSHVSKDLKPEVLLGEGSENSPFELID
ncbi:hypothetical protein EIP91_001146 [Steccherinum ochraceum]|uniref:Uncharacterized protein n=1 Tax=Steccherinum ochraceum TaxID=92696 RepID=A0A4R0RN00_9APHY|nr:hypothetical protein EIP91_001146 [Steccherinum ochraceum]